jgi:phage terminase large subunit-like protein
MSTKGKGKAQRLEHQMSPWFESGIVKISDADTPFLNALRKEMRQYPNSRTLDCMDAVYWALRMIPEVLKMETRDAMPIFGEAKQEKVYDFTVFGRGNRYG